MKKQRPRQPPKQPETRVGNAYAEDVKWLVKAPPAPDGTRGIFVKARTWFSARARRPLALGALAMDCSAETATLAASHPTEGLRVQCDPRQAELNGAAK